MRRPFLLGLALTLLLTGCAQRGSEPIVFPLDPAAEAALFEKYAPELSLVAEHTGKAVEHLDADALAQLKCEARASWGRAGDRFPALLEDLSVLLAEAQIRRECEGNPLMALMGLTLGEVRITVLHAYAALKGIYGDEAPCYTTLSHPVTLRLAVGPNAPIRHGERELALDRTQTWSTAVVLQGPPGQTAETALSDGRMPTHTLACGVLFGAVVEASWDWCDTRTGAVKRQESRTWVPVETAAYEVFFSNTQVDRYGALHVESPLLEATAVWSQTYDFETQLNQCPYPYLSGDEAALCPFCGT